MVMTPSPSSPATRRPFGPLAATRIGTAIGGAGRKPAGGIIWTTAPSTSTCSPRSRARRLRTYHSTSRHGSGFWPRAMRPVKPVPIAATVRPGARPSSVAIAAACASTCRRLGTRTAGPSPMRSVRSATRASETHTSGYSAGESYNQARSYPSDSASTACSTTSGPGGNAQETSIVSGACELALELSEPHRTEVQRAGVERLQVERAAASPPRLVARRQPHALADLVADGLARPAEVPVDLAAHEVLRHPTAALHRERQGEVGGPRLAGVIPLVAGDGQLEVQADVDDDAHRAQRLRPQHAELVRGVVEVAELTHEALGVQRSSFCVPGPASERPLETTELLGQIADLRDLEMMAGDALVVADGHLAPEWETCLPECRVPRTAGAAEVLGRARVVHRRRAARRGDHRLDPLDGVRDVEVHAVELGDRRVEQVLQPLAELVDTFDGAVGIRLEVLDHGIKRLPGQDALGHLAHRAFDAVELLPTPRVGLGEVELHPVEDAGEQPIPVGADRVACEGVRRVLVGEEPAERGVRLGGAARPVDQRVAQHLVLDAALVVPVDQRQEERTRLAVHSTPRLGLARALDGLTTRCHEPLANALGEALLVRLEAFGHEGHAGRDHVPVRFGLRGHHVEAHTYGLNGAGDDVQLSEVLAGVVELDAGLEVLAQHVGGDAITVALRLGGLQRSERRPVVLVSLLIAVGREVGHLVVVAGEALERGRDRVKGGEPLDEPVRQVVDLRHASVCLLDAQPGSVLAGVRGGSVVA